MAALDAIYFDIDDTLCATGGFALRARRNAVRAMIEAGLCADEELVFNELVEVIAEFSSNYEHHFDQLLRRLRGRAATRVNPALIVAAGVVAYHDTKFTSLAPFPDVLPLFESLRSAGCVVGVLTHGWTTKQMEKLVRLGLVSFVDPNAIFISEQIGISKPNPKLWLLALHDLGLRPEEAMYVGDHPAHDIAPPRSIGMKTVWARRTARQTLEGTGIVPDHIVDDFVELRAILAESYGLAV